MFGVLCLTDIEFGTIITFKFVYTCGVFFLLDVVCDFAFIKLAHSLLLQYPYHESNKPNSWN